MPSLYDTVKARKVAVIGAGPGGLAAAKYLAAEKCFEKLDVFDQRPEVGGVWNATPQIDTPENDFEIPRTQPTSSETQPVWSSISDIDNSPGSPLFLSPIYDSLDTNIPHTLMQFSDLAFPLDCPIFPPFQIVKDYLEDYALDLRPFLRLGTQVTKVTPGEFRGTWRVATKNIKDETTKEDIYDAVVVASGHYDDPFIPDIPGLSQWSATYPGSVTHSKFYRRPSKYENKKVIVVGNSASGIDISREISTISQRPLLISEKQEKTDPAIPATFSNLAVTTVSTISAFDVKNRTIHFSCGRKESDVDHVVFCTGYMYSFPFLKNLSPLPDVVEDGSRVQNVYQQMVYHPCPTLFFLGLPQRVVPFPISEAQSAIIARILAGRLQLPAESAMKETEKKEMERKGTSKTFHTLGYPQDADYINHLYEWAMSSTRVSGLENEGMGKLPPFWDKEKRWLRSILPQIKEASKRLGRERFAVGTVSELGFSYPPQI